MLVKEEIFEEIFIEIVSTYPRNKNLKTFTKEIQSLSPKFVDTYKQSLIANSDGLNELVGAGLRKATEFLVADYVNTVLQQEPKSQFADRIKQIGLTDAQTEADIVRIVGNNQIHIDDKLADKGFGIDDMIDAIDNLVALIQIELKRPSRKQLLQQILSK
ncbi:MAG: hypothetical protein FWF56_06050 [Firmicutes bacterium]|nr:hypothetical protein [Bacillota bacterium]MCL1953459.1 hypothetical protein [Bacillota bacterium]